jgi:hypothetical protein
MSAVTDARKGKGTVSANVAAIRQTDLDQREADRQAAAAAAVAKARAEAARKAGYNPATNRGGGSEAFSGLSASEAKSAAEGSNPGDRSVLARGGKVGYAMGTPPPGVQAQQSGFIDAPPSQVSEAGKVADDRPLDVPEGTYILNAAAVEFAGETDIRNMILEAQKEAVRRGIAQGDIARSSEMVDIAVSRGEVKIAPYLVPIIGEDRLEKINKRGLRKTEQRIAATQQEPVAARRGGFI